MTDFKEHLAWGLMGGIALAAAGLKFNYVRPVEAGIGVILAMVGAGIPDIDLGKDPITKEKNESNPFQIFTSFLSLGISIIFYFYFLNSVMNTISFFQKPNPVISVQGVAISVQGMFVFFFIFVLFFVFIRILMKNITTHRGVIHSIPFAILCTELTYMIFTSDYILTLFISASASKMLPEYFTVAVFLGCLTHLIADEFHSIRQDWTLKESFGTACTLYSKDSPVAYFVLYSLVIALFFAIKNGVTLQLLLAMIVLFLT